MTEQERNEMADRALDAIRPHLNGLPPEAESIVLVECVTIWLCSQPGFARTVLLDDMVRAVRELAPIVDEALYGPDGHPLKEPPLGSPSGPRQ